MKLVMVGLGAMGMYHIRKFTALGFELAGGVDTDPERRASAQESLGLPWTGESVLDFPGEADAVAIAVPDAAHKSCYLEADRLGRPLFLEKPLAASLSDALELEARLRSPSMVNYSKRNMGALFALKDLLDAGLLGRIVRIEAEYHQNWLAPGAPSGWMENDTKLWRLSPEFSGGGCLADLGSHLLECLMALFGEVRFEGTDSLVSAADLVREGRLAYSSSKEARYLVSSPPRPGRPKAPVDYVGRFRAAGVPCRLWCTFVRGASAEATVVRVFGEKGTAELDSSKDRMAVRVEDQDGVRMVGAPRPMPTYTMFKNLAAGDAGLLPEGYPTVGRAVAVQRLLEEALA